MNSVGVIGSLPSVMCIGKPIVRLTISLI
ncbi:hypothetical protein LINPERHAP1_LOCUS30816 [Linum perenne]